MRARSITIAWVRIGVCDSTRWRSTSGKPMPLAARHLPSWPPSTKNSGSKRRVRPHGFLLRKSPVTVGNRRMGYGHLSKRLPREEALDRADRFLDVWSWANNNFVELQRLVRLGNGHTVVRNEHRIRSEERRVGEE